MAQITRQNPETLGSNPVRRASFLTKLFRSGIGIDVTEWSLKDNVKAEPTLLVHSLQKPNFLPQNLCPLTKTQSTTQILSQKIYLNPTDLTRLMTDVNSLFNRQFAEIMGQDYYNSTTNILTR